MTTDFIVRGSHTAFRAPERGTASVRIGLEGPAPQPVFDAVVTALEGLQATIRDLHDPAQGPVTWWSTGHVRTWANRPWNKDGKQLPLVHHASVGVEVKFSDFSALGRWVGHHAGTTRGFALDGVAWALTAKNRAELERVVRTRAVEDAARRAGEYAAALGLGDLRPVTIADAGMLGQGLEPLAGGPGSFVRMAAAAKDGGAELELVPEDIEVSAQVDARFVAG